ncbi:MAG: serine threonine- phosphatase 6 regulatory subunit 3-like isoform X2 [Trebouxia sp. A1-2]|nr:MAG: serine threonine- phosphatase 6 regulatory subunit 3-like isoform X2 [Trebouxia sp. A1-2]
MFWKVSSFSSGSAIEGILDKQQVTLEELLEEDEMVQECKALNARLIAFLKEKETVKKLISFVIEPPKSWASERQQQRFPFIACEVFCCEIDGIFDALVNSSDLLAYLFSILEQARPLNSTRAGYFARVLASLLTKCSSPVMQFVQGQPWVLRKAVNHIETFSMLESLQRMVGAADQSNANVPASDLKWLPHTTILQHLTSKLNAENDSGARENAGKLLTHIGRSCISPLTSLLPSPQHLQPMLEKAFAAQQGTQLKQALHICIALLERRQPSQAGGRADAVRQSMERSAAATAELDSKLEADTVEGICRHSARLAALLDTSPQITQLDTPYGTLAPPLGSARLAVIALLGSLLSTGSPVAEQAVIDSDALPTCLQLVVQYPFNSILHHLVTDIICTALESGPPSLLSHLFQHCNLLHWLLTIPVAVNATPRSDDEHKQERPPLRAGYMGHMTQIANRLHIAVETRQEVAEHVQDSNQWQDYFTTHLAPRNEDEGGSEDIPLEGLENGLAVQGSNGSHDRYGAFDNDDYNEEDHILFQHNQGVGSVDFSDSDEEDENIAGVSDNGGLSSFPVDSWEDTWDDSDAPVSQEAAEGWGRLGSQLYQNHWETQEHSGWSDDDDHDPDMMQPHTDDHDANGGIDDDTVVVEDENEAEEEDSDAVMVDALEALRLAQPHITHAARAEHHSDENLRPQTATGSRHGSDDGSRVNGGHSIEGKGQSPSKGNSPSRKRGSNRLAFSDGSVWGMMTQCNTVNEDCSSRVHDFGRNSMSVQSGLQSRLAEAAEDLNVTENQPDRTEDETAFSSSQYWKTPISMPDDIDNA